MFKNKIFFRTLKTGLSFFTGEFVLMAVISLLNAALPIVGITLTSGLFSTVQNLYQKQQTISSSHSLMLYLVLYALFLLLSFGYTILYNRYYVQFVSLLKFEQRMKTTLHEKCSRISNEDFEDPSIYNHVIQAQNASINIYRLIEIVIGIVSAVVSTLVVSLYVSRFNPLLISFIVLALFPPVVEILVNTRKQMGFLNRKTQLLKEETAYADTLTELKRAKETQFLNLSDLFIGKWRSSHRKRVQVENRMSQKMFRLRLLLVPLKMAGDCAGFLLSLYLLSDGKINFGEFSASLMAYQLLKANYVELFSLFGYFNRFIQYVKPFFRFMDLPERETGNQSGIILEKEIELRDCSFKYPTGVGDVLKGVNLKIKKGETVAVVGYNGSGKTTLTQLILGLYLPDSGSVFYDGQDIASVTQERLFEKSSCVFQTFNRYFFTLGENVSIGRLNGYNREKVEALLSEYFSSEEGLTADTQLGKPFGGRELSGGQWQRVAIMRAFFKDGELIVLDEPTSAIDPFAESKLYEEFRKLLKDKTGIIVTHKLGSVKLADRIVVLDSGTIAEVGTHEALLEKGGLYRQLWDAQLNTYAMVDQ
ncbi:MAG TPA: ABC transporter ATP-binding protein [Thermotogota bacterium]|nr:ABC transporter ATP-binding protein [Thermotogota bacterium]